MTSASELRGAARPRVELLPDDALWSMGPECCELAAAAGREPDRWQADGLDAILSVTADDEWAAKEAAELVGRQQGKTSSIGLPRALFGFLILKERRIGWSAHQHRTTMETFLDARAMFYALGEEAGKDLVGLNLDGQVFYVKISSANADRGFDLLTEWSGDDRLVSRWRFGTRSGAGGRGTTGVLTVIDEAMYYTDEQRRAIAPTKLAQTARNPQTVYLSSPPLAGDKGEVLFGLRKRAEAGEPGMALRDWGLPELLEDLEEMPPAQREAYLMDRARWCQALPALGYGRVTEASVLQLRREFADDWRGFASEVLGLWPREASAATGWQVVGEELWLRHGGMREKPTTDLTFAVAAAWPDAAMGYVAASGQYRGQLTVQVLHARPGTGWIVEEASALRRRYPRAEWVFDKGGPAGHLFGALQDAKVRLLCVGATEVAHAHGAFLAALRPGGPLRLRHYNQAVLDGQVKVAVQRKVRDGHAWARQGSGDIGALDAVTLAAWHAGRKPRAAQVPAAAHGSVDDGAGSVGSADDLQRVGF